MLDTQSGMIGLLEKFSFADLARPTARPVGRPKTRTPAYLAGLLQDHAAMNGWFQQVHGRPAKSDVELLNSFLANEFQKQGMRPSRLQSSEVQARIKTIRNHLAQARKGCTAIPKTPIYSGQQSPDHETAATCKAVKGSAV